MVLNFEQLETELRKLSNWQHVDGSIQRAFQLGSFMAAIEFTNRIAALAEQANHHPDIDIRHSKIIVTLSTRSESGVTEKDIEMAKNIERLVS